MTSEPRYLVILFSDPQACLTGSARGGVQRT